MNSVIQAKVEKFNPKAGQKPALTWEVMQVNAALREFGDKFFSTRDTFIHAEAITSVLNWLDNIRHAQQTDPMQDMVSNVVKAASMILHRHVAEIASEMAEMQRSLCEFLDVDSSGFVVDHYLFTEIEMMSIIVVRGQDPSDISPVFRHPWNVILDLNENRDLHHQIHDTAELVPKNDQLQYNHNASYYVNPEHLRKRHNVPTDALRLFFDLAAKATYALTSGHKPVRVFLMAADLDDFTTGKLQREILDTVFQAFDKHPRILCVVSQKANERVLGSFPGSFFFAQTSFDDVAQRFEDRYNVAEVVSPFATLVTRQKMENLQKALDSQGRQATVVDLVKFATLEEPISWPLVLSNQVKPRKYLAQLVREISEQQALMLASHQTRILHVQRSSGLCGTTTLIRQIAVHIVLKLPSIPECLILSSKISSSLDFSAGQIPEIQSAISDVQSRADRTQSLALVIFDSVSLPKVVSILSNVRQQRLIVFCVSTDESIPPDFRQCQPILYSDGRAPVPRKLSVSDALDEIERDDARELYKSIARMAGLKSSSDEVEVSQTLSKNWASTIINNYESVEFYPLSKKHTFAYFYGMAMYLADTSKIEERMSSLLDATKVLCEQRPNDPLIEEMWKIVCLTALTQVAGDRLPTTYRGQYLCEQPELTSLPIADVMKYMTSTYRTHTNSVLFQSYRLAEVVVKRLALLQISNAKHILQNHGLLHHLPSLRTVLYPQAHDGDQLSSLSFTPTVGLLVHSSLGDNPPCPRYVPSRTI